MSRGITPNSPGSPIRGSGRCVSSQRTWARMVPTSAAAQPLLPPQLPGRICCHGEHPGRQWECLIVSGDRREPASLSQPSVSKEGTSPGEPCEVGIPPPFRDRQQQGLKPSMCLEHSGRCYTDAPFPPGVAGPPEAGTEWTPVGQRVWRTHWHSTNKRNELKSPVIHPLNGRPSLKQMRKL